MLIKHRYSLQGRIHRTTFDSRDSNQSVVQIIAQSKEVFPKVLGIGSQKLLPEDYIAPKTWSVIRKQTMKQIYLICAISKMNLSLCEKRVLFKQCLSLLQFNMLDVQFEDGKITRMTEKKPDMFKKYRNKKKASANRLLGLKFIQKGI